MLSQKESAYVDALVKQSICEEEVRTIRFLNTMPEDGPDSENYSYRKSMRAISLEDNGYENWIRAVIRHIAKNVARNPANLVFVRLEDEAPENEFGLEYMRRRIISELNRCLKKIGFRAELTLHSIEKKSPVIDKPFEVKDKKFNKLFR